MGIDYAALAATIQASQAAHPTLSPQDAAWAYIGDQAAAGTPLAPLTPAQAAKAEEARLAALIKQKPEPVTEEDPPDVQALEKDIEAVAGGKMGGISTTTLALGAVAIVAVTILVVTL